MRHFLRFFLPVLIWMGFIFFMSTDRGSSQHTRPLMQSVLRRLAPALAARLRPDQVERVDFNIRKSGHVLEYLVLGLLLYRAVRGESGNFRSRHVVLTLLLGVGYSGTDEWHQSFVPSRWGVAADVLYDSFGVTIATLLGLWREVLDRTSKNERLAPTKSEPDRYG